MNPDIIDRYINGDPLPPGSVIEDQRGNRWHLVMRGVSSSHVSTLEPAGMETQPTHTCQNWGFTLSNVKAIRIQP